LEDGGGLWVVPIQSVQDRVDMVWPFGAEIKCYTHDVALILVVGIVERVGSKAQRKKSLRLSIFWTVALAPN